MCFRRVTLSLSFVLVLAGIRLWPQCSARQQFGKLGNFRLQSGAVIQNLQLGYRVCGKLKGDGVNAVLFPAWFKGISKQLLAHIGPGRLVDDSRYYVIAIDPIGDGISTSPSNSATQPRMQFPRFTMADMVHAEHRLAVRVLHLPHVHAVIGISMGGFQSFQWAVQYPTYMDEVIPIEGSPRLTSYDLFKLRTQLAIIRESSLWDGGNYSGNPVLPGLEQFDFLTLTTPARRVERTPRGQTAALLRRVDQPSGTPFDLNDYLRVQQAIATTDVAAPFGKNMIRAAAQVKARMLIIPSRQDHAVFPGPAEHFAKLIHARIYMLTGDCGHLAFVCQSDQLSRVVGRFLAK